MQLLTKQNIMSCCNSIKQNTGFSSKQVVLSDVVQIYVQNIKDDSGVNNFIDLSTPLTKSVLNAMVQNSDPSKRLFPIGTIDSTKEVTPTKSETTYQEFKDQTKRRLQKGIHDFSAILVDAEPTYVGKIQSLTCGQIGVYLLDSCGKLAVYCRDNDDSKGYPLSVESNTFDVNFMFADAGSSVSNIPFSFSLSKFLLDKNISIIDSSSFEIPLSELEGLIDVTLKDALTVSATVTRASALTDFGAKGKKIKAPGLGATDFLVTDSLGTALTVTDALETEGTGIYDIEHANPGANVPVSITGTGTELTKGFEIGNTVTL